MNPQTVKINKEGMVILPKGLRQAWKGVQAFLFPDKDTLVIKRVQKPLESEWNKYEEKLKKGSKKISPELIDEAVNWAKEQS